MVPVTLNPFVSRLVGSDRQGQCIGSFLYRGHQILNGIHFLLLEIGFPALRANPCGNRVEGQMAPLAINVEWCNASLHVALTMNAFHAGTLFVKSLDHLSRSGR